MRELINSFQGPLLIDKFEVQARNAVCSDAASAHRRDD
jgi:hypothetical protein